MYVTRDIACCGMREINLLSMHASAAIAMKAFAEQTFNRQHTNFRYAVFSEANYGDTRGLYAYGREFAKFIKANKLGTVAATGWHVNPNSGNKLKAWIWTVDWDALKVWAKKARVKTPKTTIGVPIGYGPPPVRPGDVVAAQVNARG